MSGSSRWKATPAVGRPSRPGIRRPGPGPAARRLKDSDTEEPGLALRAVVRGETYLSPAGSTRLVAVAGLVRQAIRVGVITRGE